MRNRRELSTKFGKKGLFSDRRPEFRDGRDTDRVASDCEERGGLVPRVPRHVHRQCRVLAQPHRPEGRHSDHRGHFSLIFRFSD